MKFSVAVETESKLFHSPAEGNTSPNPLNWNIQVLVDQQEFAPLPVNGGSTLKSSLAPISEVDGANSVTGKRVSVSQGMGDRSRKESHITINKKKSVAPMDMRTTPEDDILRKLSLAARGRKVSRQGEWIILQEKVGVITSQNGVQQVREKRVKLGSSDLEKLIELGY